MATVTRVGPAVGSGYRQSRLRLQMDRTDASSSSSVRFRIWIETRSAESWTFSLTVYGGWSSNGQTRSSFSHGGGTGWSSTRRTLVYDSTRTFTRQYGSTGSVEGSAQLTGIGAGQSPVRAMGSNGISMTIPARAIETPNAPSGVSVSQNSNTQHVLNWNASSTTARPIERFRIQRHDGLRNPSWRTVTQFYPEARSWVDYSTQTNTRYRWRIRTENSAGVSSWVYSGFISTTPPTALRPTVRHSGGDNLITVSRGGANMNVRAELQHSSAPVGGSWSSWSTLRYSGTFTSQNETGTLRHENVDNTQRHRYRTRLENVTDTPTLQGSWSPVSEIIELLAAPNAPSQVRPSGVTLDASSWFTVSWRHNSVDGTEQTRREVRTRTNGGAWNTNNALTSDSSVSLNSNRLVGGQSTDIQVRTWGEFPDPSPWSAISTVFASELPQATIVTPEEDEVLNGATVHLSWEYFDPEGTAQAQWRATLYDSDGEPVEYRTGSGDTNMLTFGEHLKDASSYSIGVQVRDGDRLWSPEAVTNFSTDFALPPVATFSPVFDPETGATVLHPNVAEPSEDEVEVSYLQVWRSIGSGEEVLIADELPPGAAFTDYLPHLMEPNYYRVVSISALPSVSTTDSIAIQVEERHRKGWAYFNAGPGFEQVVRVRANADLTISQGMDKVLRNFSGRPRPVEFLGEHESWSATLSVRLSPSEPGHATRDHVQEIIKLPAPVCYRDVTSPRGNRHFVSLGDFSHGQEGIVSDGSLAFTRVEDPEEVHTRRLRGAGNIPGVDPVGSGE